MPEGGGSHMTYTEVELMRDASRFVGAASGAVKYEIE